MPGLGQVHNKQFIKGVVLLIMEHALNKLSNINLGLMLSFNGRYNEALQVINYDYALFYPGFYVLCVYDAVLYAYPNLDKNCSIWFIISGLVGCFGIFFNRFIPLPIITIGLTMIMVMLLGIYVSSKKEK